MRIVQLSSQSLLFPSPESALRDPNGLPAIGGDLTVLRLREAYEHGIYPLVFAWERDSVVVTRSTRGIVSSSVSSQSQPETLSVQQPVLHHPQP